MKLTFLSAAVPLTKTFVLNSGELEKLSHPKITSCTSHEEEVTTIEQFKTALEAHADQGHCLLKGNTNRPLVKESRAGSTDPNAKTSWVCLDIDGLKDTTEVDDLLKPLGLADVDHIIQYSSSMGVDPKKGLSAHVYMFTDKEAVPEFLKRWLINENLTQDILQNNLNLTRTGNALRWGLDVTTCQNDKLIYIAPPILGKGVTDKLSGQRIKLVKRGKRSLKLPTNVPNAEATQQLIQKGLNLIRARDGLPPKALSTRHTGSIDWVANPDVAQVTGIKEDGPFVHLNINGGDSWAYWHHKSNPEFIHNFKGEPSYKTSELLPEYWETVQKDVGGANVSDSGIHYLAFRDFRTANYYNAIWTPETKELEIAQARSVSQLQHFMKSNGQPEISFVPDWKVLFDPHSNKIVDLEKRIINEFQPSNFMLLEASDSARVPPVIKKTLWHLLGSDQQAYEHWLNWIAVILQYRIKTQAAWIVHGTTGTGKGTLVNEILKPIFKYVEFRRTRELDSQFNEFLEKTLILWIDEAEIGGKNGGSFIENDMKNYITEPWVTIRRMHMAGYLAPSYVNTMLSSNNGKPMILRPNDRRFNVAPFQDEAITYVSGERDTIPSELPEFAQYLLAFPADKDLARVPMDNSAKKAMIYINRAGTDVVVDALKKGDLKFFTDAKPIDFTLLAHSDQSAASRYVELVDSMSKRDYLLREELQLLLGYLMDDIPKSPYKFTSFVKHHDILFEEVIHNGKPATGVKTKWVHGSTIPSA